jgi:hypothetical protein
MGQPIQDRRRWRPGRRVRDVRNIRSADAGRFRFARQAPCLLLCSGSMPWSFYTEKGEQVKFGAGLLWVARWFAKPFDRVRFPPAPPSKLPSIAWSNRGPDEWRGILKRSAYNPIYDPPDNEYHLMRHVITHLESKLWWHNHDAIQLKHRIKELQIEVSKLKRGSQ